MLKGNFLFLGTGASSGVPMIGCSCKVCTSSYARNQRLRPSGLLTVEGKKLLIDSGPDFRHQALIYHLDSLDGVLLTHSHYDHIGGLDELRIYYLRTRKPLPLLLSKSTFEDLKRRYDYFFREKSLSVSLTAQIDFQVLEKERGFSEFLGIEIQYMQYEQAGMPVTGYRIGTFAYISDIQHYPETIFSDLSGVETLVVSVLRHESSLMHFNVEEGIDFSKKVGAKHAFFTHLGHELDYAETNSLLPKGIQLAYDGLKLDFGYG
jgi:phosphoribosyl 1,2-cyclic phosphate phosphodiesterase